MTSGAPKIDYRLRPAKYIERKMIVRALGRLSYFERLEHYRYAGFGALYFSDFRLIHELGVESMVSIERDKPIERYRANRPYKSIEVREGESSIEVPRLAWDKRIVVWLDYTEHLDSDKLEDVRVVTDRARSGSALLISVSAGELAKFGKQVEAFVRNIGTKERLPDAKLPTEFQLATPEKRAEWIRLVVNQRIEAALHDRNAGKDSADMFQYAQLFNFQYRDGAPMVTVGGVIYENREAENFKRAEFTSLPFIKAGSDSYWIPTPLLTPKEMIELNAQLPASSATLTAEGIPPGDLKDYARVYRYFPRYVDAEV